MGAVGIRFIEEEMTGTGPSELGLGLRLSERGERSDLRLLDRTRMFLRHTWDISTAF